jgi:hypothetical protein
MVLTCGLCKPEKVLQCADDAIGVIPEINKFDLISLIFVYFIKIYSYWN